MILRVGGPIAFLAATFAVGSLGALAAASPSGRRVAPAAAACADQASSAWFQVDVDRRRSTRLFRRAAAHGWEIFGPSPNGRWFAYGSDRGLSIAATSGSRRFVVTAQRTVDATWSPDGDRLALIASKNGVRSLWVVRRDGRGLHQVSAQEPDYPPTWSYDGRWLAFLTSTSGAAPVIIARSSGGEERALRPADGGLAWAPRTSQLAYWHRLHMYIVRSDGTRTRVVAYGNALSWAPSGRMFIYVKASAKFAFGVATSTGRPLRSFGKLGSGPAFWSPRGDRIAYVAAPRRGARQQLFTVRPSGKRNTQLTHDAPVAPDDPVARVAWVSQGPQKGRRLFYSRALCDTTP